LLTELSNRYDSNNLNRISFDHNKAIFGMLAMIKTIAQKYDQAQLSTFKKLKVHFLHGFGRQSIVY
jgi:ribosomal protein L5